METIEEKKEEKPIKQSIIDKIRDDPVSLLALALCGFSVLSGSGILGIIAGALLMNRIQRKESIYD